MKFLLLSMAHFLGAFVFQNSTLANRKRSSIKNIITRNLLYSSLIIFSLIWFKPVFRVIFAAFFIILLHITIDLFKNTIKDKLYRKHKDRKTIDFIVFMTEQALHLLVIAICVHSLKETNILGQTVMSAALFHISSNQLFNITLVAFLYLLCLSPAAVFIKEVFTLFSLQSVDESILSLRDNLVKSGYIIGVLERVIILTLGLNGQLGAIGFVLAAKSLARFNQLNDRNFAEKYLIGTLLSATIALLCTVIGNSLLIR